MMESSTLIAIDVLTLGVVLSNAHRLGRLQGSVDIMEGDNDG